MSKLAKKRYKNHTILIAKIVKDFSDMMLEIDSVDNDYSLIESIESDYK